MMTSFIEGEFRSTKRLNKGREASYEEKTSQNLIANLRNHRRITHAFFAFQ